MRTRKARVRQFLFLWRVSEAESAERECGKGNQTVRHVLLACPAFKYNREKTLGKVRMNPREIVNTPRLARKAVSLMIRMKLLR